MAERYKLVRHDTLPPLTAQLTDDDGLPIDISAATPRLYFRAEGDSELLATIVGATLPGFETDGVIDMASPYNVAGVGGRCVFSWIGSTALTNEAGNYEGEIEITHADGSIVTVYDPVKFKIREDF